MALNIPQTSGETIDEIVSYNLEKLASDLRKLRYNIGASDIEYELFTRCESLGVLSAKLYPNGDLPRLFGVYRGYNGGGIHGVLQATEIYRLPSRQQARAHKALDLFGATFRAILREVDETGEGEGHEIPTWDSVTL